ncbi:hypothetical protein RHSIM_Rhsim06G0148900 [Rhododendron simsii]|uniref:Uncharacterized protein n=1 Tax=Rhododendron simsii TaxID=118357 RepID=A0A834LKE2_RHOSS|nr:hypothetical protein RHSIM_Rhsim06G0148900 [Rhododendron simsii]
MDSLSGSFAPTKEARIALYAVMEPLYVQDRINEERLFMGAVVDAAAHFSNIPVILVCNKKDLHLPLRWSTSPYHRHSKESV